MGLSLSKMNGAQRGATMSRLQSAAQLAGVSGDLSQCQAGKAKFDVRDKNLLRYISSFGGRLVATTNSLATVNQSSSDATAITAAAGANTISQTPIRRRRAHSIPAIVLQKHHQSTLRRSARLVIASTNPMSPSLASGSGGATTGLGAPSAVEQIQTTLRRSARIAGVRIGPKRRHQATGKGRCGRVRCSGSRPRRCIITGLGTRRSLRLQQRHQQTRHNQQRQQQQQQQ